jgi:xanthine dehydrogenase accessory factor
MISMQRSLGPEESAMLVTVARVKGSAPREVGAKMLVTQDTFKGTIGGGELEHQCQNIARQQLKQSATLKARLQTFPLGSNCGQCCGGVVDVIFEPFSATRSAWQIEMAKAIEQQRSGYLITHLRGEPGSKQFLPAPPKLTKNMLVELVADTAPTIAIFGAGHVGTALAHVLTQSSCRVLLIDNRPEHLAQSPGANIVLTYQKDPAAYAKVLPANTTCVVMTHNHALDFDICAHLLRRQDIAFCGLIGSDSKRARFIRLFRQAGLDADEIDRLTCPIGDSSIKSKLPGNIAIAAAAQLLAITDSLSRTANEDALDAPLHY